MHEHVEVGNSLDYRAKICPTILYVLVKEEQMGFAKLLSGFFQLAFPQDGMICEVTPDTSGKLKQCCRV